MMKTIHISRRIVSLLSILSFMAMGSKVINAQSLLEKISASGRPIVLFGDSSTALRSKTKTYGELLKQTFQEKNIPVEIINAGFASNTTKMALKRMPKDVLAHDPSLVVMQFGIMDSTIDVHKNPPAELPRLELSAFLTNIETFVDAVQSQKGFVILLTPNRLSWTKTTRELYGKPPYLPDDPEGFNVILDTYVKALRELAARKKVPLVDVNSAYEKYQADTGQPYSKLLQDGMTPNDSGHQLVHDLLVEKMSEKFTVN